MNEIHQIVATLKRRLKLQGMTYRDLAAALGLSEPTVKRMFASRRFTMDRMVEISHLLGFTLAELAREAAAGEMRLRTLTREQEAELVADEKLLLVAVCALNQWEINEIFAAYRVTEAECIQRLARLDRMRLIQLLPGNRIRLNIDRDFDWLPGGPIRRYFLDRGLDDFLRSGFSRSEEVMAFSHAMLTEAAVAKILAEIRRLRRKLAELHEESLAAPLSRRRGVGLLLAMREWELGAFSELRRPKGSEPVPET